MEFMASLNAVLQDRPNVHVNPSRQLLIEHSVARRAAFVSRNGALATWTPVDSSGRSPKDTVIVRRPEIVADIDWDSPNNLPLDPATFDLILADALELARRKEQLYVLDRVVGADSTYALPVRTISDYPLSVLFCETMFRPVPPDLHRSVFADRPFTLVAFPMDRLNRERYAGRVRTLPDGSTSDLIVAIDFVNRLGVIIGSSYMGSCKKLIFTVMNYLLPGVGILPLHASANEGKDGSTALFLGLSGTGKTTLSADPNRALLGDDEHGWNDTGIANFEFGCYAKLIHLNPAKEPQIYNAIMHEAPYLEHGAIVENAMMYPSGCFDFHDQRLTENSRGSYPLSFLPGIKEPPVGPHPRTITFLTADANGVLPPVARLNQDQAMLWFLMGYTSKLAGTETGITEPVSTFSRFFGAPFMPRNPDAYTTLLGEKMRQHGTCVYLVNTGWSGGPYGVGKRMDINLTRAIVTAVLDGSLHRAEYATDPLFHIQVPLSCPGVPSEVLNPRHTWQDKDAFDARARKLAEEFARNFDKAFGRKNLPESVVKACPGK